MRPMSESFVDLSYRGLALGKRIKLTQVRADAGWLELPAPMPIGTVIGIATEDGVMIEARVAEVHEQVTGRERPPGMRVVPAFEAEAARAWWQARVSTEDKAVPQADADGKVTVVSRRKTDNAAVPELVDDGRNTAVVEAIAEVAAEPPPETPIVDDGKQTMMMDAIDLAALGLDPAASSGSMPAISDDDSGPGGKKKKKKKR